MAAAAPIALGLSVAGKLTEGIEANRAARAQANVDEENGRLSVLEGEQQAQRTREDERMQAGAMLAAMGGDGVQLGSGSAADVLAESAYQRELEVLNLRTRAIGQARNLNQSADDRRKAGRAALIGSVFGAAATALEGVRDMRTARSASQQRVFEREVVVNKRVPKMSVTESGR